jgi:hypothetical protein
MGGEHKEIAVLAENMRHGLSGKVHDIHFLLCGRAMTTDGWLELF